jgi:hypothetical protein
MAIAIEEIKKLRNETGAGIMDCRSALEQADGDYEQALDFLRSKGLSKAAEIMNRHLTSCARRDCQKLPNVQIALPPKGSWNYILMAKVAWA